MKEPEVRGPEDTDIPPTHGGGVCGGGTIHSIAVGGLSGPEAFPVTQGEVAVLLLAPGCGRDSHSHSYPTSITGSSSLQQPRLEAWNNVSCVPEGV